MVYLKQSGLFAFHEPDWSDVRSHPPAPLYNRACRWIVDTTRAGGQSWSFLNKAYSAFSNAGLPAPTLRMSTYVTSAPRSREWLMAVGDMVESLLPNIERFNVATTAEVDLPTLRNRLWTEVLELDSLLVGRSEIGIWTRVE